MVNFKLLVSDIFAFPINILELCSGMKFSYLESLMLLVLAFKDL